MTACSCHSFFVKHTCGTRTGIDSVCFPASSNRKSRTVKSVLCRSKSAIQKRRLVVRPPGRRWSQLEPTILELAPFRQSLVDDVHWNPRHSQRGRHFMAIVGDYLEYASSDASSKSTVLA
jgi:hypothetical protein